MRAVNTTTFKDLRELELNYLQSEKTSCCACEGEC